MRPMKPVAFALAFAVALVTGSAARASHGDGTYEQELSVPAREAVYDVIIVPPAHGQLLNDNGALNGADPKEATPFNSYLHALERAIDDWRKAIATFGAPWLASAVVINHYVVGRDSIPDEARRDPEVVIVNGETGGIILGLALVGPDPCIQLNTSWFLKSLSAEDFYNVSAHEFGHCLGTRHVVDHPEDDLMAAVYREPIGARGNKLHCISNLNVRAVEASFRFLIGQPPPRVRDTVSMPVSEYQRMDCGTL